MVEIEQTREQQTELPLDDAERFALLLDASVPHFRTHENANLRLLLDRIYKALKRGEESLVLLNQAELAHSMNKSRSTVQRTISLGKASRILIVEETVEKDGRRWNRYGIDWYQLRRLKRDQAMGRDHAVKQPLLHGEAAMRHGEAAGCFTPNEAAYKDITGSSYLDLEKTTTNAASWRTAAQQLQQLGLHKASDAVKRAQHNGASPADVLRLAEDWNLRSADWIQARGAKWALGVLANTIRQFRPGTPISWPSMSPEFEERRAARREAELRASEWQKRWEESRRDSHIHHRDVTRNQQLYAQYGGHLAELPQEEIESYVSQLEPGLQAAYADFGMKAVEIFVLELICCRFDGRPPPGIASRDSGKSL